MAYGLEDLLAQTGQMPELPQPPVDPSSEGLANIASQLQETLGIMSPMAQATQNAPQSQVMSSLLQPYEAAIAGSPTTLGGSDLFGKLQQMQQLRGQQGVQGGQTGGYQFGNAFKPGQDLVTRGGVTLQQSALQNLMQNPQLGRRILQAIGGGYRDLQAQQAAYNAYQNGTGNMAARPGHSYHNYGLAFDLAQHLGPKLQNYLQQLGWRNQVPGEWWHWSIGNAPWGGN